MSESKHTPGPWTMDPEFQQVWDAEQRRRIADCDHKNGIAGPILRARAEAIAQLAESTFHRAVDHEAWGYREVALELLDRAVEQETEARVLLRRLAR